MKLAGQLVIWVHDRYCKPPSSEEAQLRVTSRERAVLLATASAPMIEVFGSHLLWT